MADAHRAHSPSNEELEVDAVSRFTSYTAIKAEHEQRKRDLQQAWDDEKKKIQNNMQFIKDQQEKQLQRHHREYAAAIEDENRQYHADLKASSRPIRPVTRPEHSPSIGEMEEEESARMKAFQRAKQEHERRVDGLDQTFRRGKEDIHQHTDELKGKFSTSLAEYTTLIEVELRRYEAELKEFKGQRSQCHPAEMVCQDP